MTLARALVRRWREQAVRPLPEAVEDAARLHFLDALGVGLAACGLPAGRPYRRFACDEARGGSASIFGEAHGASAAAAAMVNGGLIHSLEYDDTHTGSIVHGSAVLAPAALAAAEVSASSGGALLGAYVRGWEALVRLGLASPGGFQSRGFQVTSVGGTLVAALIGAELFGLDEDTSVAAFGIALSQASGVFEFLSNGASVKSLNPGWAAHAGLIAAQLAEAGMTGPETAIEGRFGLFAAFAGGGAAPQRFLAELDDFGERWHLLDAAFKFHPCCHYLHPFIEAAGQLPVSWQDIERLVCRVPAGAAPIICEPWEAKQRPPTPHAARWSLPYAVAARLVEGTVDLSTFESPRSPAVHEAATRVRWEELSGANFPVRFEAELVCHTRDGGSTTVRVDDAYGNSSRPARTEEVRAKFRGNAARSLPASGVAALERAVDALPAATSLEELTGALRASAAGKEEGE